MPNSKTKQILTNIWASDHYLEIKVGRFRNIPRTERLCLNYKQLDNKFHFFLQPLDKLSYILNLKFELLPLIGNYQAIIGLAK